MRYLFYILILLNTSCSSQAVKVLNPESKESSEKVTQVLVGTSEVELKRDKILLQWASNELQWPMANLYYKGKKVVVLFDSGAETSIIRENSPILENLKISIPFDANSKSKKGFVFLRDFSFDEGIKIKNWSLMANDNVAFDRVAKEKYNTYCCDVIIGQDIFQTIDFTFYNKKRIELSKPIGNKPKNSFPIRKNLRGKYNHRWVTTVNINGKTCENARIDTAGGLKTMDIFQPWWGKNQLPSKVSLNFFGKTQLTKTSFTDKDTGYVSNSICANLGRGQLFEYPVKISIKDGYGYFLK